MANSIPNANPTAKAPNSHSSFRLPYINAGTYRFGEYSPHFVMECVNGDKISLNSKHDLRTYTLQAPLMSSLKLNKDYFQVPMECILPQHWDKVYSNPLIGDDVNAKKVNCILDMTSLIEFENRIKVLFQSYIQDSNTLLANTTYLKYLFICEKFFSNGCLLATLGVKYSGLFKANTSLNSPKYFEFDSYLDEAIDKISDYIAENGHLEVKIDGLTYFIVPDPSRTTSTASPITLRNFIERCRETSSFEITDEDFEEILYPSSFPSWFAEYTDAFSNETIYKYLNLSRILAYQISVSHYFTNDKIDYIYSAELFRSNINALLRTYYGGSMPTFSYNGVTYFYDTLSGECLSDFIKYCTNIDNVIDLINIIFGFRRSLRFMDYFISAKSRPLAIGDVNIDVNNDKVSAIDVTRNLQKQKFLNFVNRTGRKFENYVAKLGGTYVKPDFHNPLYLAHTSDNIGSYNIENTGSAQLSNANSITTILRSNSNNFAFEIEVDRPSIIIGVISFDITRLYPYNCEAQNFHIDRYDMFNPFMQFIGDQELLRRELSSKFALSDIMDDNFGYTTRHQEYKTRVNQCFGGFVESLPGFAFIADDSISAYDVSHISPDYIRSRNSELDKFYASLTGWSLGKYFHFIILNDNKCDAKRPMIYEPQIL